MLCIDHAEERFVSNACPNAHVDQLIDLCVLEIRGRAALRAVEQVDLLDLRNFLFQQHLIIQS